MKLYEEILLLQYQFDGKFVVENVIPYYEPLIQAQKRGRHLYWTNYILPNDINERKLEGILCEMRDEVTKLSKFHEYDFRKYKGEQPVSKMARNLVDYEAGRTIFETALGIIKKKDEKQISIFDELNY
jgi:DNA (cytosine-5)-methyltransferase 1